MTRRICFFVYSLFFLCPVKGTAQQTPCGVTVYFSPAVFVPVSVALQGGIQCNISKRFSFLVEGAYPLFHPGNTDYETIDYWRGRAELKFFSGNIKSAKTYWALQSSYLYRKLTDNDQAFYYTKTQTFSYQNAIINSPVLSSSINIGAELPAGKRTVVDAFIGLGLRFIFTKYQSKSALVTSTEPPTQGLFDFDDAWLYNYTLMRFHVAAGLRFGFRL